MKQAIRRYGEVAVLLLAVLLLCIGTVQWASTEKKVSEGTVRITASFYPVYIAALQLTDGVSGVEVSCLAQPQTGCLHDYQLTPSERLLLEETDVLLLNGAGAEAFLTDLLPQLSATAVDGAEGIALLGCEEEHGHDEHGHVHADNEHLWMSPSRYAEQVANWCDGLCQADPAHAVQYRANAARYTAAIEQAGQALRQAAAACGMTECVLFHDSLAYLAEEYGWTVLASLPIGEEAALSAAQLSEASEAIRGRRVLLLYDDQYNPLYTYLADGAERAVILSINTAVRGENDKEAWLRAMYQTAEQLKGAAS